MVKTLFLGKDTQIISYIETPLSFSGYFRIQGKCQINNNELEKRRLVDCPSDYNSRLRRLKSMFRLNWKITNFFQITSPLLLL
jgi:hypothetical protein